MNNPFDFQEPSFDEIKECELDRKTRTKTLMNHLKMERKESVNWPSSIDIRELEGNIYLKGMIKVNFNEINRLHQNKGEFLERLRFSIKRVKSYVSVFETKAKLLLKILINLMENFGKELRRRIDEYKSLYLIFDPWLDIIKNQKFKPEMLKLIEKEKINQLNIPGDSKGRRFRSCSQSLQYMLDDLNPFSNDESCELENMEEKEKDVPITKTKFLVESQALLGKNEKFLNKMKKSIKNYDEKLNRMLKNQSYLELLEKIDHSYKYFSSVASKKIRELLEGENIFNDTNPENNLFVLEFRICNLMKKFREKIDQKVIFKFYSMMKEVESHIFNHHSFLKRKLSEFSQAAKHNFGEEIWLDSIFTMSFFNKTPKKFDFLSLISPCYARYMKKYLQMKDQNMISNEDSIDFFHYFQLRYQSKSPLVFTYIECSSEGMKGVTTSNSKNPILCIDIFGSLCLMLFATEGGNNPIINLGSYSMGFFFPLSRVIIELKKDENLLFLRYLQYFDIDQKSKKKSKVKEVSLKVLDVNRCDEFVKTFYKIFKIRKSLSKKGVVWNNSNGALACTSKNKLMKPKRKLMKG